MKDTDNRFEVNLGELKISEDRKDALARSIQKLVLDEVSGVGRDADFAVRLFDAGRFDFDHTRGIWIERVDIGQHRIFDGFSN